MGLARGTDIKPCKLLQVSVAEHFGTLAMEANKPMNGATEALISPLNRAGVQMTPIINSDYKNVDGTNARKVQIKGIVPKCDDDCDPNPSECSIGSGTKQDRYFKDVTVDESCTQILEIDDDEFFEFCDNRSTYVQEQVAQKIYALERNIEKKVATKLNSYMGTYADGTSSISSPLSLPFLNPDKTPNLGAFNAVVQGYMNRGYSNMPLFVSGSLNILDLMKPSLGLNNQGIDLSKVDTSRNFFSNLLNPTLNPAEKAILTWIPGTFQFVEHNGVKQVLEPSTVIVNGQKLTDYKKQITTFMFGNKTYILHYEYDCGIHKWAFTKYFDVIPLPVEAVCDNKYPALKFLDGCLDDINCGDIDCSLI